MKKIACLLVSAFFMSSPAVFAQGEMDAYKLSQFGLNGTARYLGMSGAFGALGGDVTSMTTNPAGLSIYRSSEVVTTLSLNMMNAKTDLNSSKADASKTKFNFDNIAYVAYFPTGNDAGIKSWNVGFAYNRLKNFDRKVRMTGRQNYSMADYFASKASGIKEYDLGRDDNYNPYFDSDIDFLPILGYEAGFFDSYGDGTNRYHSAFGEVSGGKWSSFMPVNSEMDLVEKGSVDQYNFSFSTNVSDVFFLGATLSVTDMNYKMFAKYADDFANKDFLYLENYLESQGTGYAVNVGTIVRPVDFLRLGVAYNSPTWYNMTDYYQGYAETEINNELWTDETPSNQSWDYKLRTPDRWIFSAAGIIGRIGLVSVDYEMVNYKNMNLSERNDLEYEANNWIEQDFGVSGTLKVGTEIKVTPQFAVRAGGAFQSSPVKSHIKNGETEILTAGTLPHYTVDKGVSSFSVGFGYRFTPNFYADIACVYRMHKEDLYSFSNVFETKDNPTEVLSDPISLKTNTTRVALTLGYKF